MIEISNVSMCYKVQRENIKSLKEYVVNVIKGKVTYDEFCALDNININIGKGEVCGIIGSNGAGKSTLLKLIAGVLAPTTGEISVKGTIAPMLELGAGFDQDLTARENIYLNGAILGYSKEFLDSKYNSIVDFSELHSFMEQPIRTFSSGMMMRLAFSIATIIEPEILIVDEILSVGDAHFAEKSSKRMKELMSGGTTVIMVSHVLQQIEDICDRVIWLENGKIVLEGESMEVCNAYRSKL
ncbi:ABC transporter ATP-binding protein [Aminipila sp.]|uniref:ABC transporter ATP-binding protein n=1 Tax=Aminipila sp. TaxID=2060095 RepID=UPI00289F4211|nr:ABC transporter ATP-binding protein [Aminipila sp.]